MNNYLTTQNQISAPGSNLDVWYGPWDSVNEYIEARRAKFSSIPLHHTILVRQEDGSYKLMRNDNSATEFNLVEGMTTTINVSGDGSSYALEPSDWNITEGYMNKGTDGHYTDDQYDKMRQNSIGITNAIKFAYSQGYSDITLKRGTYCFCPRDYEQYYGSVKQTTHGLPAINLIDLNNVNINLNGSKLCLLIDSLGWSKYTKSRDNKNPCDQGATLMQLSYCNNIIIRNGDFVGDRFIRDYVATEAKGWSEAWNESTYGIMIGAGNSMVSIQDCIFTGFMGDGISGQPNTYFNTAPSAESGEQVQTIVNFISKNDQFAGWDAYPENTWGTDQYKKPSQKTSCEHTVVTPLYTTNSSGKRTALIDVSTLYTKNTSIKNRKAHKDSGMFQIVATGGYNRTPQCYPNCIGVLTYDEIDAVDGIEPKPIRYLEVAYMDKFKLNPTEKYLRLQFFHEDHCAKTYDAANPPALGETVLKKVQNPMFRYRCISATTGNFDTNKWERFEYDSTKSSPTYDSTHSYSVGDEVYYYALLPYRCIATTNGTWDITKWEVLTGTNPGNTANYNNAQSYLAGSRVTQIATEGYIPHVYWSSSNFKPASTDKLWFPSVAPLVGVGELHTYGVEVLRCKLIDSHRGNMSNMPNDTVVRDCYFHKNFHIPGDGTTVPNFSGDVNGTVIKDTTQYSIDLEDYIATSFKVYNTRFETPDLSTGMILLNTLNQVVDGCSGQAVVTIYNSNSSTVISNNTFDRSAFGMFPGNNRNNINALKDYRKHIVFENNKVNLSSMSGFDPYGQDIELVNNSIQVENMVSSTYGLTDPVTTGGVKFIGNRINSLALPSKIIVDAAKALGNDFTSSGKTEYELYSPCECYGSTFSNSRLSFHPGIEKIDIRGLYSKCNDMYVCIPPYSNNKYEAHFKDCRFESGTTNSIMNFYYRFSGQGGHTATTLDIYFNNCEFTNKNAAAVTSPYCYLTNSISGDQIRMHFKNCDFNLKNTIFTNNSIFTLVECSGCTFTSDITFNGVKMQNK